MPVTPEHYRAARLAVPRLPLWAIFGFALFGAAGSVFLTLTTFSNTESERSVPPSTDARVYEARAVPFESQREDPAQRAASISRALTAAESEGRRAGLVDPEQPLDKSEPILLAESDQPLRGFDGFGGFAGTNTYLTVSGTSFGISAQSAPAGFAAPDAETLETSAVPETSTWLFGAALFVLVGARGLRARLHRRHRRTGQ